MRLGVRADRSRPSVVRGGSLELPRPLTDVLCDRRHPVRVFTRADRGDRRVGAPPKSLSARRERGGSWAAACGACAANARTPMTRWTVMSRSLGGLDTGERGLCRE